MFVCSIYIYIYIAIFLNYLQMRLFPGAHSKCQLITKTIYIYILYICLQNSLLYIYIYSHIYIYTVLYTFQSHMYICGKLMRWHRHRHHQRALHLPVGYATSVANWRINAKEFLDSKHTPRCSPFHPCMRFSLHWHSIHDALTCHNSLPVQGKGSQFDYADWSPTRWPKVWYHTFPPAEAQGV